MKQKTISLTLGGLLHRIGLLCCRAGQKGNPTELGRQFLQSVWPEIPRELLDCMDPKSDVGAILKTAELIAFASDVPTTDGGGSTSLQSVFTHLNGEHPGWSVLPLPQDQTLRMPVKAAQKTDAKQYASLLAGLEKNLRGMKPEEAWIHPLLNLLAEQTGTVPGPVLPGETTDLSFFDRAKLTAAAAACIGEYAEDSRIGDLQAWIMGEGFRQETVFLLYTADFSGIQKFIYTVATKNAVKSLRSRSFFLELVMEHYIDELLAGCGVSRTNLIYSGGGHCYLLLPNTEKTRNTVTEWNLRFNDWLLDQFGVRLYLADGMTPCCADELTNVPAEKAPYREMFRRLSGEAAKKKLHRYSPRQLMRMNTKADDLSGRECRICGRTDELLDVVSEDGAETQLCSWCAKFEVLSSDIQQKGICMVLRSGTEKDFRLPTLIGDFAALRFDDLAAARSNGQTIRCYIKNKAVYDLPNGNRIDVGDYSAGNSTEDLSKQSEGVRRLAVCRMDVDNLGASFVRGYEKIDETGAEKQKYVTLARTAAFSRQMSLFFKRYINPILNGEFENQDALQVSIVYSGGDDVFLLGAWTDVMEAAERIHTAFRRYSCEALSISCGIGVFDDHFPIRVAAEQTAELEDDAKDQPGKNAISVFSAGAGHAYPWSVWTEKVTGEKLGVLSNFFDAEKKADGGQDTRGNAFLYRLLDFLRETQRDPAQKINLARFAYLLARLQPKKGAANYETYRGFADKMYRWAQEPEERRQLITAIYLYVYRNRKGAKD